ncbi:MAG: S8 family serine peptidase [Planctomycetes bacterium]|nr:S8 family serine peptidase [Planctomycetota bacterium]
MARTLSACCVGGIAALGVAGAVSAGEIDPALGDILRTAAGDEVISTIVYLADQADLELARRDLEVVGATPDVWNTTMVGQLYGIAQATQGDLVATLTDLRDQGRVERFDPYWVANMVRVDAVPAELQALAKRPDVQRVYFNFAIELIEPVSSAADDGGAADGGGGPEDGVLAVRAPEAWALGIDGTGVLVATLDTGVDGSHSSLQDRWAGSLPAYAGHPEWAFFDPVTGWTFPQDDATHGTHTMGSVCGGLPGDQVGVAPGAKYIHAAVIDRVDVETTVADAISAFQWMLNPDSNFLTGWDMPLICSNSWGVATFHGYPECDELFWQFLDNCENSGIMILFAGGNEGFSGVRRPADRATTDFRTFAVGAVNGNNPAWPIAGFSSRGPTFCGPGGAQATKPEIVGPGVDVRSAAPGGGYSLKSGTSMSTPHLNGVAALVRQACPALSVQQVKQILHDTAVDLGAVGDDDDYGWGMVDAFEAVNAALAFCNPSFPPEDVNEDGSVNFADILAVVGAWG